MLYTPRTQVDAFARAMEAKLQKNDWKGGWQEMEKEELKQRALEELAELFTALEGSDPYMVLYEAADVGNIIMFIADNYGNLQHA